MNTFKRAALIASPVLALCCSAPAIAKPPAQHDTPVIVHFDAPNSNYDLPLVSEEGWSLKLKITVPYTSIDFEKGGLPRPGGFPSRQGFGWIFLENPDGCYRTSAGDLLFKSGPLPNLSDFYCTVAPVVLDDIYIEYHADVDQAGVEDIVYGLPVDPNFPRGRADLRELLVYSEGSRAPEFSRWLDVAGLQDCDPGTNDPEGCVRLGPAVSRSENTSMGGEVLDGWGFGTDEDLPGLFIYTEKGAGLIWQEPAFELAPGAGVRNLAGMANSVSFEVSDLMKVKKSPDPTEEFKIWVDFNVLAKTFQSFVQVDANFLSGIQPGQLWRIDGGEIEDLPLEVYDANGSSAPNMAAAYLLKNQVFTVKAFMVSGDAPPELFDTDGDGDYVDDAEAAGYVVLSNVAEISFLQIPNEDVCVYPQYNAVYDDLDDDDFATYGSICPRGAGALRDPPR